MRAREFVITEAPIGQPGLFKYSDTPKDRVPIFLEKIIDGTPFRLTDGRDVVIDPAELDKVTAWMQSPSPRKPLALKLKDSDEYIPFGSIVKTKEFGGEKSGSREGIEQGQIDGLSKELEKLKAGKPFIKLIVGKTPVHAARVAKTSELIAGRQPKSDMTVYDENDNPVAWVSLKGASFKKWGGFHHLVPTSPEIQAWIAKIKEITGGVLGPKQSFGHHIKDDLVKNKIVFGKDFGGPFGISNVNVVLVGYVTIKSSGKGSYKLSADTIFSNGETPTGVYEPYLTVRFMTARPDIGLKNARAETNTKNETRKVRWLDDLKLEPKAKPVVQPPAPAETTPGIANLNKTLPASKIKMGTEPQEPETTFKN